MVFSSCSLLNMSLKNIKPIFELRILREMLSFSTPLIVSSLAGIILTVTDRYMLRFLVDLKAVGIYSLGFKVANTLRVFIISSVMMALQPTIYKMMNAPDNKRFYSKSMTYFSFGLMICVLGLSFHLLLMLIIGKHLLLFLY